MRQLTRLASLLIVSMSLILISVPNFLLGAKEKDGVKYYDASEFELIGKIPSKGLPYGRLPDNFKGKIRKDLWHLGECSAGLAIRFRTNSPYIRASWKSMHNFHMYHMTDIVGKGLDLYCMTPAGDWRFAGVAWVKGSENESRLVENMSKEWREFMLYLPMYDGIEHLKIGIDPESQIERPAVESPKREKPIVFYGTSIQQGGCASRSGMAYTNYISRKLDRECINLGFSGNGRLDLPIAELMAKVDASCYVLDFVPNATVSEMDERMEKFYHIIRDAHPEVPIIFTEDPIYTYSWLDKRMAKEIASKNAKVREIFNSLVSKGEKHIEFIPSTDMIGDDGEAAVDGIHFTDLGMKRYSEWILPYLEKAIKTGCGNYSQRLTYDENGNFRILQLTDLHWTSGSKNCAKTEDVIRKLVASKDPDIIMITGDVVTARPAKKGWEELISIFNSLKIPYMVLMGNHDPEYMQRNDIYALLEKSPYYCCENEPEAVVSDPNHVARKERIVNGRGNGALPIYKLGSEKISTVLYCFDSNNYTHDKVLGHFDWIRANQLEWYLSESRKYTSMNAGTPVPSYAFLHIPLREYHQIDRKPGTYGNVRQAKVLGSDVNSGLFAAFLDMRDVKGVFCGHDHHNDYIGIYKGIALAFGRTTGLDAQSLLSCGGRVIDLHNFGSDFSTYVATLEGCDKTFYYPSGKVSLVF